MSKTKDMKSLMLKSWADIFVRKSKKKERRAWKHHKTKGFAAYGVVRFGGLRLKGFPKNDFGREKGVP